MATDAPQSGPVAPAGQLDLKSAPLPEVEKQLGTSPDGLESGRGDDSGWRSTGRTRSPSTRPTRC